MSSTNDNFEFATGGFNVPAETDRKTLDVLGDMIQTAWTASNSEAEAKLPEEEKNKKGPPFTLMFDMRSIPDSHPSRSEFVGEVSVLIAKAAAHFKTIDRIKERFKVAAFIIGEQALIPKDLCQAADGMRNSCPILIGSRVRKHCCSSLHSFILIIITIIC